MTVGKTEIIRETSSTAANADRAVFSIGQTLVLSMPYFTPEASLDENYILANSQVLLEKGYDQAALHSLRKLLSDNPRSSVGLRALARIYEIAGPPSPPKGVQRGTEAGPAACISGFDLRDADYLDEQQNAQLQFRAPFSGTGVGSGTMETPREQGSVAHPVLSSGNSDYSQHPLLLGAFTEPVRDTIASELRHSPGQLQAQLWPFSVAALAPMQAAPMAPSAAGPPPVSPDVDVAMFESPPAVEEPAVSVAADRVEDNSGLWDEWETHTISYQLDETGIWDSLETSHLESLPPCHISLEIPDKLTREERALQVAVAVADDYGWGKAGAKILVTIFDRYWWSASQAAIRRQIEAGMTPKELVLAEDLRQMWYQRCDFWVGIDWAGNIDQKFALLSWPSALSILRSFEGYPSAEEVEVMLDICLERWIRCVSLQRRFPAFFSYALYRVGAHGDLDEHDGWVAFDNLPSDDDGFDCDDLQRELTAYGLRLDSRWQPQSTRIQAPKSAGSANQELDIGGWQIGEEDEPC